MTPGQYARRRAFGWGVVGVGVLVGASHLLQHLGAFTILPHGVADLFMGYPAAVALGIAGAIVLSK